jgi:hypothetical protein
MRRLNFYRFSARAVDPTVNRATTGESNGLSPIGINDGNFYVALKRRGLNLDPSHDLQPV